MDRHPTASLPTRLSFYSCHILILLPQLSLSLSSLMCSTIPISHLFRSSLVESLRWSVLVGVATSGRALAKGSCGSGGRDMAEGAGDLRARAAAAWGILWCHSSRRRRGILDSAHPTRDATFFSKCYCNFLVWFNTCDCARLVIVEDLFLDSIVIAQYLWCYRTCEICDWGTRKVYISVEDFFIDSIVIAQYLWCYRTCEICDCGMGKVYITPSPMRGRLHNPQPMKQFLSHPLNFSKPVKLHPRVVLKKPK
jgi:hypothetical protein